jgi:hypothetical protein
VQKIHGVSRLNSDSIGKVFGGFLNVTKNSLRILSVLSNLPSTAEIINYLSAYHFSQEVKKIRYLTCYPKSRKTFHRFYKNTDSVFGCKNKLHYQGQINGIVRGRQLRIASFKNNFFKAPSFGSIEGSNILSPSTVECC